MTERVLLLLLVFGGVIVGGVIARWWARRRQQELVDTVALDADKSGATRILAFYGPSCDACDRQKAVLAQIEAERPGEVMVELRDAASDYDYARQFGLVIVPTTVVIRPDGSIASINSGFSSRRVLEGQLDAA